MSSVDTGPNEPTAARQYEFTPEQDQLIGDLALKMRFVGLVLILIATLSIVAKVILWYRTGIIFFDGTGLVFFLLGYWTFRAGRSFLDVAWTTGRDITNLLRGLTDLWKMYGLIYWLMVIAIVLSAVALFFPRAAG